MTRPTPRIVSLVPSLTEAVAACPGGLDALVAVTDWCTHPADLDDHGVRRIRGTKNPDVKTICELNADIVLANEEENKPEDLQRLRDAGQNVLVTHIRTVADALTELPQMITSCGLPRGQWLADAETTWRPLVESPTPEHARAVVLIWRKPWMAVGCDTFTGDMLRLLGVRNVLADNPDRYPKVDLDQLPDYDLAILPDEPYQFNAEDGPEAFPTVRPILLSGRLLTWYGPSMVPARAELAAALSG